MFRLPLLFLVLAIVAQTNPVKSSEYEQLLSALETSLNDLSVSKDTHDVDHGHLLGGLTRQVMMQQLLVEESARTGGSSGIKQVTSHGLGPRNYFSATFTNAYSVNAIYDRAQDGETVGMGQVSAVLNGVEFRTGQNDYQLRKPHSTSQTYLDTEAITFPGVPPAVTEKATLDEQIEEMRLWFKAWSDQDDSVRDYKDYFKPILCYLEGTWVAPGEVSMAETEEVRYRGASGTQGSSGNLPYVPTKIASLDDNGDPVFAHWSYRTLCQDNIGDIPTSYFRAIDDLSVRMRHSLEFPAHQNTRRARFFLHDSAGPAYCQNKHCYLDTLMEQIPGADNVPGNLRDQSFGVATQNSNGGELNSAYYHRYYKTAEDGSSHHIRGFSDMFLYMAQNSRPEVSFIKVNDCREGNDCVTYEQRWTYAVPLEIIYLTPLHSWNPLDLPVSNDPTVDGRDGDCSDGSAFDGINQQFLYQTPVEFFSNEADPESDPADTGKDAKCVRYPNGAEGEQFRTCAASGVHIFLPDIPGVGRLRTRYPIAPVNAEGTVTAKDLEALKDIVMDMQQYGAYFYENPRFRSPSDYETAE